MFHPFIFSFTPHNPDWIEPPEKEEIEDILKVMENEFHLIRKEYEESLSNVHPPIPFAQSRRPQLTAAMIAELEVYVSTN